MENNKNTQRWDGPAFNDHSSNDSDENTECFGKMLIVEEEDDHLVDENIGKQPSEVRSYENEEVEFDPMDDQQDDVMDFKE